MLKTEKVKSYTSLVIWRPFIPIHTDLHERTWKELPKSVMLITKFNWIKISIVSNKGNKLKL